MVAHFLPESLFGVARKPGDGGVDQSLRRPNPDPATQFVVDVVDRGGGGSREQGLDSRTILRREGAGRLDLDGRQRFLRDSLQLLARGTHESRFQIGAFDSFQQAGDGACRRHGGRATQFGHLRFFQMVDAADSVSLLARGQSLRVGENLLRLTPGRIELLGSQPAKLFVERRAL